MVIAGSSGSLQMVDHTMIDVPLANVHLDSPYYKGQCKVMRGARWMLPDPNWKADNQKEARARTSGVTTMRLTTKVVICLVGCSRRSPTEERLRTETQRRSQPRSRRMITMLLKVLVLEETTEGKCVGGPVLTRAQTKKSDKIHSLKVKEATSSVDKTTIEDLQKKDSTLKKCFDRVGKPIIRENYVGEFNMKNGLLYRKHQEMKTGRRSNQLVVPKGLRQQVMSVNHESAFSGHQGAKKTEVRILPNFF